MSVRDQLHGTEAVKYVRKHDSAASSGRRRIQTHGEEWRAACAELGIPDEPAFHDLPIPRKRIPRKLAYRCRHCGLTVQRVRAFAPYTACYKCCKKYTGGKYHADFLFLRIPFPPAVLR